MLTGFDLEQAWTSVPAFEQVYGFALHRRGVAGGLILAPKPDLFEGVIMFDFRSLYPSIIRTFHVDPLALLNAPGGVDDLVAPNTDWPRGNPLIRAWQSAGGDTGS